MISLGASLNTRFICSLDLVVRPKLYVGVLGSMAGAIKEMLALESHNVSSIPWRVYID